MMRMMKMAAVLGWLALTAGMLYVVIEPWVLDRAALFTAASPRPPPLAMPDTTPPGILIPPSADPALPVPAPDTMGAQVDRGPEAHLEIVGLIKLTLGETSSWATVIKMLVLVLGSWFGLKLINAVFRRWETSRHTT